MKKTILLHLVSIALLVIPNLIYLICNLGLFKEAHALALTMVAIVVLCVIGLGALLHFKVKAGIWVAIIGAFVLSLSNISFIAGIALLIEGAGLAIDGYFIQPLIIKAKIKELKDNGESITYTREIG